MKLLRIACSAGIAAALTIGTASAQAFTSPNGYLTTEGSSNHDYILFKYNLMRWQQLDDTNVGLTPSLVQRISWRRDGTSGVDSSWGPRTMDVQVVLSDSAPAGSVSLNFDANFVGTPNVAFTMKPVVFPDWTQVPATTPAPFDLVLPLDNPWPHLGQQPMLWEVRTANNASASDFGNDFQSMPGSTPTSNAGSVVGTGCVVGGQTSAMALAASIYNQVTRFRIAYSLTNGPATSPVFANIDLTNSNLTIPGLCSNLIAAPTIPFLLGQTDLSGSASLNLENIPFNPGAVGMTLYSQAIAFDATQPGLPFALSNGRSNVVPNTPSSPAQVTRLYEYQLSSGSMRAPSAWTGGIVTRFD